MIAIHTKYYGPTDSDGSKIRATDGRGNKVTIPYPHELSDVDCYAKAAKMLCKKMEWKGTLVAGGTQSGYVFCFTDSDHYQI